MNRFTAIIFILATFLSVKEAKTAGCPFQDSTSSPSGTGLKNTIAIIAMSVIAILSGFTAAEASGLPTGWSKRINQDPMDDSKQTYFYLEPHRVTGTPDPVLIGISCEAEVFFIVTYEIIDGDIDDLTNIQIRFDKNKAEIHEARTYVNYSRQAQLRKSSMQTITKMLQSKEMILGIPIRTDGRIYAWFDVSQAHDVLSDCIQMAEPNPESNQVLKSNWTLAHGTVDVYATSNIRDDDLRISVTCIPNTRDIITTVQLAEATLGVNRTYELIQTVIYSGSNGIENTTDNWLRFNANMVKIHGTRIPELLIEGNSVEFVHPSKETRYPEVKTAVISLVGSAKAIKPVIEACE